MFFVVFVWIFESSLLVTSHPFLKLGIAAVVIPAAADLSRHRILTMKFVRTSMYWTYSLLVYELTAMRAGWWQFPRHDYLGWVSFGTLAFPLEELVFWVFGVSIAGLTYYEHFIDDHR
jgi:hypothetical protein